MTDLNGGSIGMILLGLWLDVEYYSGIDWIVLIYDNNKLLQIQIKYENESTYLHHNPAVFAEPVFSIMLRRMHRHQLITAYGMPQMRYPS